MTRRQTLRKAQKGSQKRLEREPTDAECRYRTVVLLDDFTASGLSYLRNEKDEGPTGKIQKIWKKLKDTELGVLRIR